MQLLFLLVLTLIQLGLLGLPHPQTISGNVQKHLQWPRENRRN